MGYAGWCPATAYKHPDRTVFPRLAVQIHQEKLVLITLVVNLLKTIKKTKTRKPDSDVTFPSFKHLGNREKW